MGYTADVKRLLQGRADVRRVPGNAGDTERGLERLDQWVGEESGSWDVIHFNWGLWDLCYRNPDSKNQGRRDKVRGKLTRTVEEYAANLERIVERLDATGASLIFASTTPVPPGELGRKVGDDVRYNEAARAIMLRLGVRWNDLHGLMKNRMAELARAPGDVHFTNEGSALLAARVARAIESALSQRFSAGGKRGWRPTWTPTRSDVYKVTPHGELEIHGFLPQDHATRTRNEPAEPVPAVVFFFGGGWSGGTPSQFYPHCDYLASRGIAAFSAEYRVRSRHGTNPFVCVHDAKSAVRWLRRHAMELGIDPDRIVAAGGSAGGHLAAATATVRGLDDPGDDRSISCRPSALVLFNPVYDNGPGEYGHDRVGDRYLEISPAHNIREGTPPALVFFGTDDRLVSVESAKRFQRAMRDAGARSELRLFDGRGHGFFNHGRGDGNDYVETVRSMDEFLASLGMLDGSPVLGRGRADR